MAQRGAAKPEAHEVPPVVLPFGETPGARNPRALSILAATIYRELRGNGFEARDVMALAGELLGHVTSDVRRDKR